LEKAAQYFEKEEEEDVRNCLKVWFQENFV
jgi:hypothetical protein